MVDPQMMRQVEPEDPLNYSLNKFRNVSRVWMSDLSSDEKVNIFQVYCFLTTKCDE